MSFDFFSTRKLDNADIGSSHATNNIPNHPTSHLLRAAKATTLALLSAHNVDLAR